MGLACVFLAPKGGKENFGGCLSAADFATGSEAAGHAERTRPTHIEEKKKK